MRFAGNQEVSAAPNRGHGHRDGNEIRTGWHYRADDIGREKRYRHADDRDSPANDAAYHALRAIRGLGLSICLHDPPIRRHNSPKALECTQDEGLARRSTRGLMPSRGDRRRCCRRTGGLRTCRFCPVTCLDGYRWSSTASAHTPAASSTAAARSGATSTGARHLTVDHICVQPALLECVEVPGAGPDAHVEVDQRFNQLEVLLVVGEA
jgi:hypothetical protein